MKKLLAGSILALLLGSCGGLYHTKYSNSDIRLGESKHAVIGKYGRPYAEELSEEDGKQTEVLIYKESMAYGYQLKTYFHFRDGVLVKKTQTDDSPSKVVVKEEQ